MSSTDDDARLFVDVDLFDRAGFFFAIGHSPLIDVVHTVDSADDDTPRRSGEMRGARSCSARSIVCGQVRL
jgi:hypothetical protein